MGGMIPQIDARGCVFGANVVIDGSAVISEGCELGAGCYIGPRVRLGRGCVVGPGTVIGSPGFGFKSSSDGYAQKDHSHGVTIGDDVMIGANTCIDAGYDRRRRAC
jgi:UDP-3-O-[3-hydroxymyristoyl] glucosamine N-acyltransferase